MKLFLEQSQMGSMMERTEYHRNWTVRMYRSQWNEEVLSRLRNDVVWFVLDCEGKMLSSCAYSRVRCSTVGVGKGGWVGVFLELETRERRQWQCMTHHESVPNRKRGEVIGKKNR